MKNYQPDYYNKFKCIADKCSITCCQEWKIAVDDATNRKWKKLSPPDTLSAENLYNVYLLDRSDNKTYSIEAVPWDEVLGYTVDEASIAKYGDVKFTALVLYEMTYFGFSEKQIQNTIKAFNDEETLYPKAGKCY